MKSSRAVLIGIASLTALALFRVMWKPVLNPIDDYAGYRKSRSEILREETFPLEIQRNSEGGLESSKAQQATRVPHLTVHLFGFNRPKQFVKLWNTLTQAEPATQLTTSVVIHIDHDETNSTDWQLQLDLARHISEKGDYRHGPVSVLYASKNKGLRATMIEAWAPLDGEYAMFLEDDIEVSPLLFTFAERYVLAYGETSDRDPSILGYKLYNQKWDEVNQRFEDAINNGAVPFRLQEPCSWGSIFVAKPYARYLRWYTKNKHIDPLVPNSWSNTWNAERSAKKYMQRFLWESGMYLLAVNLPDHFSLTTPRMSAGTNIKAQWLDFLKARLELPLLRKEDVLRLQRQGVDPFATPPARQLWILDHTHTRVSQVRVPNAEEIKALGGIDLPPASVIDPKNLKGARWTMLDKAKTSLTDLLSQPRAAAPASFGQATVAALKDMLLHSKLIKVPGPLVQRIANNPTMLFVVARMLYGPSFQRVLVIEVQYGMTNRLRALSSAKAIADATGRLLVVIWEPDAHCRARLPDLMDWEPRGVLVVDDGRAIRDLLEVKSVRDSYVSYDLMKPNAKFIKVDGHSASNIFVRSAFQVYSKAAYQNAHIINLRELSSKASPAVRAVIEEYHQGLPTKRPAEFHAAMVGVHVRMVASVAVDTPGLTAEEALRMELATAFRVSCHYKYFLEKMLEYPSTTKFFLSSDSPEAYKTLSEHPQLKSRVFFVANQGCTERSPRCMAFAAADLLLLSRTTELLVSKWSAFSETAGKLGGMPVHDTCDEPEGGWKLKGPAAVLTNQIIKYLKDKQFPGVERVANALGQFKM